MNIPELRQSLKLQWLNYYQKNRSWLVKMRIWCTCDGERRPLASFILGTLSVLEPQLEQLFPFILELSNNPDQIIAALGLNFNPERELHLVDTHNHDNSDRNHPNTQTYERSLWEDLVYDTQPQNAYMTDSEMVEEQALMQNHQLMTMLAEEEAPKSRDSQSNNLPLSPELQSGMSFSHRNPTVESSATSGNIALIDTPQIPSHSRAMGVDRFDNQVQPSMLDGTTPTTMPTKIPATVATSSTHPTKEVSTQTIPKSVPFHTFVLDEITGLFHQIAPGFRDVQQPSKQESPPYTLGETISIAVMEPDKQVTEPIPLKNPQESVVNQEEDISESKKKRFNLASWIDDFCQGSGWDYEEAIFIRF